MTPKADYATHLAEEALRAFDDLNGPQPGYRPAHAKGILLAGKFIPAPAAKTLTNAPHVQRSATRVTVRFSDFGGIPTVPDNDPNAGPRGIAIRFHLAEHLHTDLIGHSVDGFPTRTTEEFVEFLGALHASPPGAPKPSPVEKFLATHPAALEFVQTPKPVPASFSKETYYSVNAYKFTNAENISRYGRYRVKPDDGSEYLDEAAAAKLAPDFLFDEIRGRLAKAAVKMRITVQVAAAGDNVNDSTAHWPKDRPEIAFGTIELAGVAPNGDAEQRHIIFDPIPRVAGIEPSGDPLLEPRATLYLMSGRRRRTAVRS